ncbi:baseplate J/gp47 family protein [Anaerococcus lactolyticus]|uniref:baseplate J/gp47 family protein n=1 Tax=Anaerococcus lactolyticus TaxID=33032 RepID=UPI0023F13423|nr:baseplate J/gp47 family protein [Anaerococcus lactolyticus]
MKTHEEYLDLMLNGLENTKDKTPNSFSYDVLSAAGILFVEFARRFEELAKKFDVDNLEGLELEKRVFQITGLKRKQATYARGLIKITGTVGTVIDEGKIFQTELGEEFRTLERAVIGDKGEIDVKVEALRIGPFGDVDKDTIKISKDYIKGIESITNPVDFTNGYGQESEDDLRERYYSYLQDPPKAGNPAHYRLWAEEVDGVGYAKVYRTWKGPSTVKVVIIDIDRKGASSDLVEKVRKHIIEEAPIHWENLTVVSAKEKPIDVAGKIEVRNGYSKGEVLENIKEKITAYLAEVAFKKSYVSFAKVAHAILESEGLVDFDDLRINGTYDNIDLADEEVAVLGQVRLD